MSSASGEGSVDKIRTKVRSPDGPAITGNKFVTPGILLFADNLIVAAGGWLYWIIVSKFATSSDIGQATALYSLAMVANTIVQLGLEYPLLKRSSSDSRQIFGSILLFEVCFASISMTIAYLVASSLFGASEELKLITLSMLLLTVIGFVSRYSLLGLSRVRNLMISDCLGTIAKFTSGWFLLSAGYGEFGIMISLLLGTIVTAGLNFSSAARFFGLVRGNLGFIRNVVREGLVNAPSKLSGTLIISLCVVLLAVFGTSSAQIGVFYIAMMLAAVLSSFSGSLAFMSIPASSAARSDLSSGSLRIGIGFTAPVIALLAVSPTSVLYIIGDDYSEAGLILTILAFSVLPGIVVSNTMSRLNTYGEFRRILLLGIVRIGVFLLSFSTLVPQVGTTGAAISILIAVGSSAALSVVWVRNFAKFVLFGLASIGAGTLAGTVADLFFSSQPLAVISSIATSIAVLLFSKCTTLSEMKSIVNTIGR